MSAASSIVLAYIPSPDRGVWHLGPLPIRAYAVCIIVGIIVAIWWGDRRLRARGGEPGTVADVAVFAVPFGLVGGRLYHVITDHELYFGPGKNPVDALKIWNGGLGIWGAIALGGVGAWIACRRRGIPMPVFADAVAPGIVLAQAIGRLGNYFNQELYGRVTTLPWGLELFRRTDPTTGLNDQLNGVAVDHIPVEIVQPTFLYEMLWNIGVAVLVVWADRRFRLGHGRAFALYVAAYTAGRFWVELLRDDPATHVFGVRINVITSVVVFAGAVVYFVLARRRGPREDLAALRGDAQDVVTGESAPERTVTADESVAEPTGDGVNPAPGANAEENPGPAANGSSSGDTESAIGTPDGGKSDGSGAEAVKPDAAKPAADAAELAEEANAES